MRGKRASALMLTFLMLASGCMGIFDQGGNPVVIDCQEQPSHQECFVPVITEDDCSTSQIFAGDPSSLYANRAGKRAPPK